MINIFLLFVSQGRGHGEVRWASVAFPEGLRSAADKAENKTVSVQAATFK